jgi:hypothetical protein
LLRVIVGTTTAKSARKTPAEWPLLFRIALFVLVLPLAIRAFKIQRLMEKVTPNSQRRPSDSLTPDRIMYLCERMLRLFQGIGYKYSCMRRSIVLYHFLRSYGVPVTIHFGAKWDDGGQVGRGATGNDLRPAGHGAATNGACLAGHSWVTLDENVLLDSPDNVARFSLFFSFPPRPKEPRGAGAAGAAVARGDKELAAQDKISFD